MYYTYILYSSTIDKYYTGYTSDLKLRIERHNSSWGKYSSKGIPWQFEPMINEIEVHPGEMKLVKFYAKNESARDIIGQAVPSVSPGLAAAYFQKIEWLIFCHIP